MSFTFHFVRHAPVIGQDGIAYGRDADIDTSCTKLFASAASKLPEHSRYWIASEYPRAQETGSILQKFTGAAKTLVIDPAFNEQNFGDLAGRKKSDIIADPAYREYLGDITTATPPGGESVPGLMARVLKGMQLQAQYMHAFAIEEAVVATHGGVIRAAEALHKNAPFNPHMKVPYLSVHSYTFDL